MTDEDAWRAAEYRIFDRMPPEVKRAIHEAIFFISMTHLVFHSQTPNTAGCLQFIERTNQAAMRGAWDRGVPPHDRLRANW